MLFRSLPRVPGHAGRQLHVAFLPRPRPSHTARPTFPKSNPVLLGSTLRPSRYSSSSRLSSRGSEKGEGAGAGFRCSRRSCDCMIGWWRSLQRRGSGRSWCVRVWTEGERWQLRSRRRALSTPVNSSRRRPLISSLFFSSSKDEGRRSIRQRWPPSGKTLARSCFLIDSSKSFPLQREARRCVGA
mgnify:CR=1 FL=1